MPARPSVEYGPEVQTVSADTPVDDLIYLLKRDGGVFVKNLVPVADVQRAYDDVRHILDNDVAWDGNFFPKETQRASSLVAHSPTYVRTQLMNPLYQAICAHFLTTRTTFWWGDEQKESVSKPQVHSTSALRIGPGGAAQPLHRDDYIAHNVHEEIEAWDDERDARRESAVGLFVAGTEVRPENGGTVFVRGSHLWGTHHPPPHPSAAIRATLSPGDAFIMLASAYHGGGHNATTDEQRLVFSTFVTRGYLRQEENQYLAVPLEKMRGYDRATQEFVGYGMSEPACGWVEQNDPIFVLRPEEKVAPKDF